MTRPTSPFRRSPIDEPLDAPLASIPTVLGVFIRVMCLIPANTSALLAIPVRNIVVVEAALHSVLPGRVLRGWC